MNTKQLEYFISVAESLNFTTAARKCFISQAAMTQQIKALEDQIGVSLFSRTKHKVELTPAGFSLLNDAKSMLTSMEQAEKRARAAAEGLSGHLWIGIIRGYEYENISKKLRQFHQSYPNIHLEFTRHNMSNLYELLEDKECDLIFNLSPYQRTYPHLNHQYLTSYPLYAVFYPGHPLAGRKSLTYRDLKNEQFIIMQPKDRSNDEAEEVLLCYERGGFIPNIIHREREVQTLLLMISAGLGIALLPEYCITYFRQSMNLIAIPMHNDKGEAETLDFEISWNSQNPNPAIGQFLDLFVNEDRP